MNDQNPNLHTVPTPDSKPSLKDRVLRRTDPAAKRVKTPSTPKEKVKTALAVVGTVAIGAAILSKVAKDKGVDSIQVDLPTVDVTTEAS